MKYFKMGFEKKAGLGSMLAKGISAAGSIHTGMNIAKKSAKAVNDIKGPNMLADTTKFFRGT